MRIRMKIYRTYWSTLVRIKKFRL